MLEKNIMNECPLRGFDEFVRMNVVPRCFHCGGLFVEDEKHSCKEFKVFKPVCECINKATIRVIVDIK
jgi:hypothetical protein